MSGRHESYKGSSRSTRDDSRQHKDVRKDSRGEQERRRPRSRSRSPRRRHSPPRNSKYSPPPQGHSKSRSQERDFRHEDKKNHKQATTEWDSEEEVPAPPSPPRITPISIKFSKGPIKMNIAGPPKPQRSKPVVASVFNDDDDEPEEMPAEARMRMRNIGRETPTSAGPNSFGKTKQGFCDAKKVFEKNLKQALEAERPDLSKLPQTIYKIKPSS